MAAYQGLELWNKLELSDRAYVKPFDRGGFKGTAVDPLYNVKRVTELLGPVGQNWGWKILNERLDTFGEGDQAVTLHSLTLRAWFAHSDGSIREFDHIGHTKVCYRTRGPTARVVIDEEYGKKSLTDALSKILVHLGASADIWLGRFDGNKNYQPPSQDETEAEDERPPRQISTPANGARAALQDRGAWNADQLVGEARAHLKAAPGMDEAVLRQSRDWLRSSPDGRQPSRWANLGTADQGLREELLAAMNKRAAELGISLKEAS